MNDKNEKTFADLFMNSKDDESNTSNIFSSSNNEDVSKDDSFSFGDFNNISNQSINEINKVDNMKEEINNIDVNNSSNGLNNIFNVASSDLKDERNNTGIVSKNLENADNVSDNNNVFDQVVDNKINENNTSSTFNFNSINDSFNLNENKQEEIKVEDNIFSVASSESNENVFGFDDSNEDVKEEIKIEENEVLKTKEENTVENEINEEANINVFGLDGFNEEVKEETKIENDESLKVKEEIKVEDNNKNMVEENNNLEEKVEDDNSASNEFVIDSPLFSNKINLDESDSLKKDVGKVDLSNTKHFQVKVVPKKEPLVKFIIGVISYAFFIWLLLIGITLLVYVLDIKIRASKGDYSAPTFNAYVVLTGSMLPEIQVNDVVITKRVDADKLDVGDIITFASTDSRFAGTIITHRIIKKNPSVDGKGVTFQTKGDNNNVADSALVPAGNIYGKVILKIPKLGYLQEFLAAEGGWIIVILIPCLTVISYDIVKIAKGLKRKKYNNIKVKK